MKRYERLEKEGLEYFDSFYAEDDCYEDIKSIHHKHTADKGYTHIRIFRVKTDTKGLPMYEVWVNKTDYKCRCIKYVSSNFDIGKIYEYKILPHFIKVQGNNNRDCASFVDKSGFNEYFEEVG